MPVPGGTAARKLVTAADCSGGRPSRLPAQASTGESLPGGHRRRRPAGTSWFPGRLHGAAIPARPGTPLLAWQLRAVTSASWAGTGGGGRGGQACNRVAAGRRRRVDNGRAGGPALHSPLCWDRGGRMYSGQSSRTHLLQALMQWAACPTVQAMQQPSEVPALPGQLSPPWAPPGLHGPCPSAALHLGRWLAGRLQRAGPSRPAAACRPFPCAKSREARLLRTTAPRRGAAAEASRSLPATASGTQRLADGGRADPAGLVASWPESDASAGAAVPGGWGSGSCCAATTATHMRLRSHTAQSIKRLFATSCCRRDSPHASGRGQSKPPLQAVRDVPATLHMAKIVPGLLG